MGIRESVVAVLLVLAPGPLIAQVAEVTVTGQFRPSALNPGNTEFENTTPRGDFCNWRPVECDRSGAYIFNLGRGELWRKSGEGDPESKRDTTYVRFPEPRTVTLTEERTGRTIDARISFVAISLHLSFGGGVDPWYYGISGGCSAIRLILRSATAPAHVESGPTVIRTSVLASMSIFPVLPHCWMAAIRLRKAGQPAARMRIWTLVTTSQARR